jgi:curved DNA-binding protein
MGGAPPGDLLLHLHLVPHPRYRVTGHDIEMDLPLWPWQAVLGVQLEPGHLPAARCPIAKGIC